MYVTTVRIARGIPEGNLGYIFQGTFQETFQSHFRSISEAFQETFLETFQSHSRSISEAFQETFQKHSRGIQSIFDIFEMDMIRYLFQIKMPQLAQPLKAGNLNCWDLVLSIRCCNNIMNSYDVSILYYVHQTTLKVLHETMYGN